ncbi:MAG: GIY-YIG nuclease family protein [Acetobacter orientalis]|uniref:GIY-YIG nuclease family protein n=1 Tax=Acetobacter orientalis TaxID=146474 RepID=UPI0039E9B153
MEEQNLTALTYTPKICNGEGIVYILTNPVMPGLIKIGITGNDLPARMKQLYSSGVPVPFECAYAKRVQDYAKVEATLHMAFGDHRINSNREFFRIDPERVRAIFNLLPGEDVIIGEDAGADETSDIIALKSANKRASVFNFKMVDIKPGSVLEWIYDPNITCTVVDDRKVDFENNITSLSAAACEVGRRTGLGSGAYQGPRYWKYQGKILTELREEMEQGED